MSPLDDRYREVMRQLADATEPDADTVARVRHRLDARLVPTTRLLSALEQPSDLQVQRVRARLARRRPRERWPVLVGGGLVLSAAAAAAVSVAPAVLDTGLGEGGALAHVEQALSDEVVAVSDHVVLSPAGEGEVVGADRTWRVAWERGSVGVDVTPEQGVDLEVRTPEATVRVVGTGFDVSRDRLGTTVTVRHGRVEIDCALGSDATLGAGEDHTCWPASAAGLLGRAHALDEGGAAPVEVLEALDLGLSLSDATGAVRGELLAASLPPLVASGRHADALSAAEDYLTDGGARPEIRRYAALLALSIDGCDRAVPHLEALPDRTSEEEAALRRCTGG